MKNLEQKSDSGAGAAKVHEYVQRIQNGEPKEKIMTGLADSFRAAITAELGLETKDEREPMATDLSFQKERQKTDDLAREDKITAMVMANKIRSELGMPIPASGEKRSELSAAKKDKLVGEIEEKYQATIREKRATIGEEMFMVAQGFNPDNGESFPIVDGTIGMNYDAHGVAKTQQLETLLNLLENGVSKDRDFHTAPFEAPGEIKAGLAAAFGTSGGTAYKDGLAVLTAGYKEKIQEHGIKHVFINDVFSGLRDLLEEAYPQYKFHLLSEQKAVLEGEAAEAERGEEANR